jgi:hypothetical protein
LRRCFHFRQFTGAVRLRDQFSPLRSLICFFSTLCITKNANSGRGHSTPLWPNAARQASKGVS